MCGEFLSWMAYYQGVVEPVIVLQLLGIRDPRLAATFRDPLEMAQALAAPLADGPWLLGARYSAADLLLSSAFLWFPDLCPENPRIRDWVRRAGERPAVLWAKAQDNP